MKNIIITNTQFQSLVSNIPGVVYRCACDDAWSMKYISDYIESISGYPPSDFIDNKVRSFESIIHRDDSQIARQTGLDAIDRKNSFEIEYRIINVDGTIRWVYEKGRGVYSDNGRVLWIDGAIFNITDRKKAESKLKKYREHLEDLLINRTVKLKESSEKLVQEIEGRMQTEKRLHESEEQYHSMMGSLNECVYICSPDFRVEYMNPAMVKRTKHNASGEPCHKAINNLEEKCPWCAHEKVQKGESYSIKIVSPFDGQSYHVFSSPIYHSNGSISKMTIYANITKEKQNKENLKTKSRELRETNTALKVLLKKKEEDLDEITNKINHNVRMHVSPYLAKLKDGDINEQQSACIKTLEMNLLNIVRSISDKTPHPYHKLTPTEIFIADLIKEGKKSVEMAKLLNVSSRTIDFHRRNIRKKFGLKSTDENLRSYLLTDH